MIPIRYWEKTLLSREYATNPDIQDTLERLHHSPTSIGIRFKKLHHYHVWSARTSRKGRLIFTIQLISGIRCLILLDYLPNHELNKSKVLNKICKNQFSNLLEKSIQDSICYENSSELPWEDVDDPLEGVRATQVMLHQHELVSLYLGKFITLSSDQKEACLVETPAFISGKAGTGKTCCATEILKIKSREASDHRIIYVAKRKHLVNTTKHTLMEASDVVDEYGRIECKTLLELQQELFPDEFREKEIVGKEMFKRWFALHIKTNHAYLEPTSFKKMNFDDQCKVVYEECRIIASLSAEEYYELGARQSFFHLKTERTCFFQVFTRYLQKLNADNQIDPGLFYQSIEPRGLAFILCDESQELSLAELKFLTELSNRQFICIGDLAQDCDSSMPNLDRYSSYLKRSYACKLNIKTLTKTHRSGLEIIRLCNEIQKRLGACIGGYAHAQAGAAIIPAEGLHRGQVIFVEQLDEDPLFQYRDLARGHMNVAVITQESCRDEIERLYDTPLVYGIHDVGGLQFSTVIIDNLLDESYEPLAKLLKQQWGEFSEVHHRPKKENQPNLIFSPYLNTLLRAILRAENRLIFIQKRTDGILPLWLMLKSIFEEQALVAATNMSPLEEDNIAVEDQIRRLQAAGNTSQAEKLEQRNKKIAASAHSKITFAPESMTSVGAAATGSSLLKAQASSIQAFQLGSLGKKTQEGKRAQKQLLTFLSRKKCIEAIFNQTWSNEKDQEFDNLLQWVIRDKERALVFLNTMIANKKNNSFHLSDFTEYFFNIVENKSCFMTCMTHSIGYHLIEFISNHESEFNLYEKIKQEHITSLVKIKDKKNCSLFIKMVSHEKLIRFVQNIFRNKFGWFEQLPWVSSDYNNLYPLTLLVRGGAHVVFFNRLIEINSSKFTEIPPEIWLAPYPNVFQSKVINNILNPLDYLIVCYPGVFSDKTQKTIIDTLSASDTFLDLFEYRNIVAFISFSFHQNVQPTSILYWLCNYEINHPLLLALVKNRFDIIGCIKDSAWLYSDDTNVFRDNANDSALFSLLKSASGRNIVSLIFQENSEYTMISKREWTTPRSDSEITDSIHKKISLFDLVCNKYNDKELAQLIMARLEEIHLSIEITSHINQLIDAFFYKKVQANAIDETIGGNEREIALSSIAMRCHVLRVSEATCKIFDPCIEVQTAKIVIRDEASLLMAVKIRHFFPPEKNNLSSVPDYLVTAMFKMGRQERYFIKGLHFEGMITRLINAASKINQVDFYLSKGFTKAIGSNVNPIGYWNDPLDDYLSCRIYYEMISDPIFIKLFSNWLEDVVSTFVPGQELRILSPGGGTGRLDQKLISCLDAMKIPYQYTLIEPAERQSRRLNETLKSSLIKEGTIRIIPDTLDNARLVLKEPVDCIVLSGGPVNFSIVTPEAARDNAVFFQNLLKENGMMLISGFTSVLVKPKHMPELCCKQYASSLSSVVPEVLAPEKIVRDLHKLSFFNHIQTYVYVKPETECAMRVGHAI